jgi:hypothetical protein
MAAVTGVGAIPGTLISWAAGVIGIPATVVRAQINEESGGQLDAVSPTGAQGPAQFEPGTWQAQGCTGSPDNANDAMKCYAKYMYSLVQQYHGNVRDALAAYNAGPDDLSAGYGYADTILSDAGQTSQLGASGGTGPTATLDSSSASAGTDCAIKMPSIDLGVTSIGGTCLVTYSTERALIAGALMGVAGIMALAGLIILAAAGFQRSGALSTAADAAAVVPGAGRLARGLTVAHGRMSRTGAQA